MLTVIMVLGMCTTVSAAGLKITRQPENAVSAEGNTVIFEVAAEPADNVTCQWQQGVLQKTDGDAEPVDTWTDIPEASGARYEHKVTAADLSGNVYRCKVSMNGEEVYSEIVAVTAAGILPVLMSKDSTSITVQTLRGQEYTIYTGDVLPADTEWKNGEGSVTFTGLTPSTEYRIVSRAAASDSSSAGGPGKALVVTTAEEPEPVADVQPEETDMQTDEPNTQTEEADGPTEEPNTQTEEADGPTEEPNTPTEEPPVLPDMPKLVGRTDTTLEVEMNEGQEYRIDQKEWQDSGRFEGLSPDTEYAIETRMKGQGEETPVSAPLRARTMKPGAGAPEMPKLVFAGVDTIEVKAADGAEYAICEGRAVPDQQWNWQISPVFSGLKAATEYSVAARIAGAEDQMPGAVSELLIVSTGKYEAEPLGRPELISVSDTRIEVAAVSGQVYAIYKQSTMPEGLNWQSSGVFEKLHPNTEYRIVTKTPETAEYKESMVSEALVVTTQKTPTKAPEAPKLTDRSQTVLEVEKKNGQEYSIDGGKTWQTEGRFEKLKAETDYEIVTRIKETSTAAASAASQPLKVSTLRNPIETGVGENKITGISNGQIIKVNKNVTFTAEGGGMKIEDPIDGDVRYVPVKWQGMSEGTWKKAPYTATVKAAKSGTYTIKVTFDRQVYKNGKWISEGQDDIKSVQLKATATGRAAVKTGDETQGMLHLILLAAAAGAAGIVGAVMKKQRRT